MGVGGKEEVGGREEERGRGKRKRVSVKRSWFFLCLLGGRDKEVVRIGSFVEELEGSGFD